MSGGARGRRTLDVRDVRASFLDTSSPDESSHLPTTEAIQCAA